MDNPDPTQKQREAILAQLASLTAIERGTLSEEFRQRPAPDGQGIIRKGPYYKHQCWENKRNRSRRVPAQEVSLLREDLKNSVRFYQLVDELASLAIAHGRAQRTSRLLHQEKENQTDAKKNSVRKASGKDTAKPKRSSHKSRRASRKKDSPT